MATEWSHSGFGESDEEPAAMSEERQHDWVTRPPKMGPTNLHPRAFAKRGRSDLETGYFNKEHGTDYKFQLK